MHRGIEFDVDYVINRTFTLNWNAAISHNYFDGGSFTNKILPKQPSQLSNFMLEYCSECDFSIHSTVKYVGKQYVEHANTDATAVDSYYLLNLGMNYILDSNTTISGKINNLLDVLYITHGDSGWGETYWPGATRNAYIELRYQF